MNPIFRRNSSFLLKNRTLSNDFPYHNAKTLILTDNPNLDSRVYGSNSFSAKVSIFEDTQMRKSPNLCSRVYGVYGEHSFSTKVSTFGGKSPNLCSRVYGFCGAHPCSCKDSIFINTQMRKTPNLGSRVYGVHSFSSKVSSFENTQMIKSPNLGSRVYGFCGGNVFSNKGSIFGNIQVSRVYGACGVRSYSTDLKKFPEYEMPTVTWGIVQGKKEKLVAKVIICDYLKSLGILTDELEDIELPTTVEVMRERVEFLQKLGLTIDDINEYPLMLGCSVRKNVIPVLGYLEKLGIHRSRVGEFVKRYPQVLHTSVIVELVPVVRSLRGLDIERMDIAYVLEKYPELLGFKPEGTMSTSVAYLISIGVNPRDIGPMLTQYPFILGMRVGVRIKPLVDYLVSLGLPKKILARMFEKRPYVIGYDLEECVKPNVECLINFGISKEALPSVIAQYPQIIGIPLKAKLSSQQYFFNLKLKMDPEGFARLMERMPQIVSLSPKVIIKPIEFLLERGIPTEDVAKMLVKCPQLVTAHIFMMKNSFYFFKTEMDRPIKELVEFPEYFTYSFESRIKPRYQMLQNKGIKCSLSWFLNCSDRMFEERLRGDYIETESAGPSFYMGGKLELPGNHNLMEDDDESDDEVLYRRTVSL